MSPSESAALDALLAERGYRVLGNVSPDIHGATDDEINMLFGDRQEWGVRELRRLASRLAPPQSVEAAS